MCPLSWSKQIWIVWQYRWIYPVNPLKKVKIEKSKQGKSTCIFNTHYKACDIGICNSWLKCCSNGKPQQWWPSLMCSEYSLFCHDGKNRQKTWWRHQMETFSALLAICAGNSPVPGEFPAQRPVTRSFDVFFDLRLNKRLSKQSWGWWFETLSRPLWRHRNDVKAYITNSQLKNLKPSLSVSAFWKFKTGLLKNS